MPHESENNKLILATCEKYCIDICMINSSDEEEEDEINESFVVTMAHLLSNRRSIHLGRPKSNAWLFDDHRFRDIVRLSPTEIDYIFNLIKEDEHFKVKSSICQLPVELQLQIVLFRLCASGDMAYVRKISSLFGVSDGGTIRNVTVRVFKAILKLKNKFLFWPNKTERLQIVSATNHEMPGCIGYIGGSEIKLAEAPVKSRHLYFSRKRQYSIKIQVICDYNLSVRAVTTGYPGGVHDAKIFSNCPLAKNPERFFSDSQWMAGGSVYPTKSFLLTPFRQNSSEHTKEVREEFNKYFSKYRVRIDDCFSVLKEKFGSLKELRFRLLDERNVKECNNWIMVCCILHNLTISLNPIDNKSADLSQLNCNLPTSANTRNSLLNFIQTKNNFASVP